MAIGRKTGGRKKGTPNKNTNKINASEIILKHNNPFEEIVRLAKIAEQKGDIVAALNAYKDLAQYIAPKRKAIEVTGEGGGALEVKSIGIIGVPSASDPDT